MRRKKVNRVSFRRRREGKTDYRKRLALLKSGKPRAVVRKTLTKTIVQIIGFHREGDRVLSSANSPELRRHGWEHSVCNIPSSYLTGLIAGKRAMKEGVEEAVLDIGLRVPVKGSNVFAALKGLLDAGMELPHGDAIFPEEDILKGSHIDKDMAGDFKKVKASIINGG